MSWDHTTVSTFDSMVVAKIKEGYHIQDIFGTGEIIDCWDISNNHIELQRALLLKDGQYLWMEEYLAIKDLDCDGVSSTGVFFYDSLANREVPSLLYRLENGDIWTQEEYDEYLLHEDDFDDLPDV